MALGKDIAVAAVGLLVTSLGAGGLLAAAPATAFGPGTFSGIGAASAVVLTAPFWGYPAILAVLFESSNWDSVLVGFLVTGVAPALVGLVIGGWMGVAGIRNDVGSRRRLLLTFAFLAIWGGGLVGGLSALRMPPLL